MRYLRTFRSSTTFQIFLIFFSLIGIVYQLLFSPWGNRLLSPVVESILSTAFSTPLSVDEFSLTHNQFDLLLRDRTGNTVSTQGGFSLMTLRMYAHYRIDYPEKGGINTLGIPLKSDGSLSGGIAAFDIHGRAFLLNGDVVYRVQLHRFKLASLYAELHRISYERMLHLFEYPSSTDTLLSGVVDLKGFDRRSLRGFIRLDTKTGRFTPTEILPKDDEPFDLRSLLADKYGRVKAFDVNVSLQASMDHAGILEQFAGIHLASPASLDATLTGDRDRLTLHAASTLARSETALTLLITELEPEKIDLLVKHADLPQLFALFALPSPLRGNADVQGAFTPQKGELSIAVNHGTTLPDVLKREYGITQPPVRFDARLSADLSDAGVRYRGSFASDLQRIEFADSVPHDEMLRELLKTIR
jgi:hypothetical protein